MVSCQIILSQTIVCVYVDILTIFAEDKDNYYDDYDTWNLGSVLEADDIGDKNDQNNDTIIIKEKNAP